MSNEKYYASIKRRDPAARNSFMIFFYPSVRVLRRYRFAHFLWSKLKFKTLACLLMFATRNHFGIDIHPGATIGKNLFIDHGIGTVIGETSIIGDNVTLYHGVTLGGRHFEPTKRHPNVDDNVVIGACATILGNITIGKDAIIGANAVVLKDVAPKERIHPGTLYR